ncbi:MAG TPA: hypothetical protein P5079_01995 [Elusimicrobiota bacterium]|nr:hypothetical protein [Elusimicrobiota bacterium]
MPSAPAETPLFSVPDDKSPVYLTEISNPNDFVLFANGGWDGNWYVGYNTCWVSKLPPAPPGEYKSAFLGARLGRMKTESVPGRPPWEKRPIKGFINMAVADEPLWPQSRRFRLTETADIPLEGDAENAVEGVGESRWFWVEVPLKFISFEEDNYVALFSPSEALSSSARAPVLAAAWGDTRQNTWLNSTVKGEPPFTSTDALKTPVTYFEPAIAIKLVPVNDRRPDIRLLETPEEGATVQEKIFVSASVSGRDMAGVWVEFSTDTKNWRRAGSFLAIAPYVFTVKREQLLEGTVRLRVAAEDVMGNRAQSPIFSVRVPPPPSEPPKKRR